VAASAHIPNKDFSAVIERAQQLPGFTHEPEPKFVTAGFGHETTLGAAGAVGPRQNRGGQTRMLAVSGIDNFNKG